MEVEKIVETLVPYETIVEVLVPYETIVEVLVPADYNLNHAKVKKSKKERKMAKKARKRARKQAKRAAKQAKNDNHGVGSQDKGNGLDNGNGHDGHDD